MSPENKGARWIVRATWTALRYIFVFGAFMGAATFVRYKYLSPTNKLHLWNFVIRLFDLSLAAMSKTRLGFVLENLVGVVLAGLILFIALRIFFPKADGVEQAKNSALAIIVGLVVSLLLMGGTFAWKSVTATYDDHNDMAGRWQAVVKEKDNLKSLLQQRDDYIKRLEVRPCATCPSNRHAGPPQGTTAPENIHDILAEVRITCVLTNPSKMPEDLILMMPAADETYFEGASGKSYLQSRAASYKRTEEEGKVTAIENFKLPPNSDLIGRPISVLADYPVLRIAAMSVGVREISECVAAEVALRVNGQEVLRSASAVSVKMDGVHGLLFGVKLAGMNLPK